MDVETDYYELLGIEIISSLDDINKAYRKMALKVHPDKNPSPDAAVIFHNLKKAHDVLMDPIKKSEYDQEHRARQESRKRRQEMDSRRREEREQLEKRETDAKRAKTDQNEAKAQYDAEIARLREEGAKRRQEDWNNENNQQEEIPEPTEADCMLKIKWKPKKYNFTEQSLKDVLDQIAAVDSIAFSQKKEGSAFVIFKSVVDAHNVITKKESHPALTSFRSIDWATGKAPAIVEKMNRAEEMKREARAALFSTNDRRTAATGKPLFAMPEKGSFFKPLNIPALKTSTSKMSDNDYESIVLMKMRQAERDRVLRLQAMQQH